MRYYQMRDERRVSYTEWRRRREKVLSRDNHQCVNCRCEKQLEVHHIVPVSAGGEDGISNLCTLCSDCHRRAHNQRSEPEEESGRKGARWIPSLSAVRRLVQVARHPLDRLVVTLPAKTGVGVGELCNLRCSDLALSATERLQERVEGRKSVLRVRVPSSSTEQPGRRERQSDTLIPLDEELKRFLIDWMRIRPDTPHHEYLLSSTSEWGRELTPAMVRGRVGNAVTTAGVDERLTPLTLRHFFAEQYPDDGLVRNYLLGHLSEPPRDYSDITQHYRQSSPRLCP